MKIALIQAPVWGVSAPPLALASLSAYLRREGHQVLVLDLNIELYKRRTKKHAGAWKIWGASAPFWSDNTTAEEFVEENKDFFERQVSSVLASGVKIVGFSIYESTRCVSLSLARLFKKKNKNIIVVFGGPDASRDVSGQELARDPSVDYVVQGEGEATLAEIARIGKAGVFCKGALIRRGGEVLDCGDRDLIGSLDSLPYPDFSDYKLDDYLGPSKLPIVSSRGCCNKCVYCSERRYWRRFRAKTGGRIYSEIMYQLQKHPGENFFTFLDSLVNGKASELEKWADLVIKSGKKIRWSGLAAIRKEMTRGLLLKLKKSGCLGLGYGMETASVPLMFKAGKLLSKGCDPEKIIRDGYRAGVGCIVNFMFGLPGETEEDFKTTLRFIKRNSRYLNIVAPMPDFCDLSEGTYAQEHPDELGIDLKYGRKHWESKDGTNTYPVRLRRFEEFCRLVRSLKIRVFYPHAFNRDLLLGDYHLQLGETEKAIPHFLKALEQDAVNGDTLRRVEAVFKKAGLREMFRQGCARMLKARKAGAPEKSVKNSGAERYDIASLVRARPGRQRREGPAKKQPVKNRARSKP